MTNPSLREESTILRHEVYGYAELLTSPDVLENVREYKHLEYELARSIGKLAGALAIVDDAHEGIALASKLIETTEIDGRSVFSAWYNMQMPEHEAVREKLYTSSGLNKDGSTPSPDFDWSDAPIVDLMAMGNHAALQAMRERLEPTETEDSVSINFKTRNAVKLYQNDPSTPFQLVLDAAEKARAHALEHAPEEKDLSAEDASKLSAIIDVISFELTPRKSEIERMYAQTDIALRHFAADMLREGRLEDAQKLQDLMISPFYVAELNSERVALGLDPEGTYADAVAEYIQVYADEQQHHTFEMAHNLVIGGYEPYVQEYREAFLSKEAVLVADDIPVEALVALYKSGEHAAHEQLLRLYPFAGSQQWKYPKALKEMGEPDEARRLLYSRFNANPTFENGLAILHDGFDFEVYSRMGRTLPENANGDMLRIISSKCSALGRLAIHIRNSRTT